MKIKKTITTEGIEELYNELNQTDGSVDLILPNSISSWDFGITTLLLQFINSWIRKNDSGRLILDTKDDLSDLEDIVSQDYCFPAIIMEWDKGIFDLKGRNIKPQVRLINEKIIEAMQSLENLPLFEKKFIQQKGYKSLLTCFDHLPPEKGLLSCFYSDKKFILSEKTLADSLEETINYILSFNRFAQRNFSIKKDLVEIIYELMKNTHDWARTNTDSQMLNPNTRGVFVKFLKKQKGHYMERYGDHLGLQNYFTNFSTTNKNSELYFIEISVFDSGVGFVDKYTSARNNDVDIYNQVNIIKDCLIKHNTSDKTLERENKGIGLDRIMQILNGKGMFLIRTGNAFVFRSMKDTPYISTTLREDIKLYDWVTSSEETFTKFNKCVGSNITIVYPLTVD